MPAEGGREEGRDGGGEGGGDGGRRDGGSATWREVLRGNHNNIKPEMCMFKLLADVEIKLLAIFMNWCLCFQTLVPLLYYVFHNKYFQYLFFERFLLQLVLE